MKKILLFIILLMCSCATTRVSPGGNTTVIDSIVDSGYIDGEITEDKKSVIEAVLIGASQDIKSAQELIKKISDKNEVLQSDNNRLNQEVIELLKKNNKLFIVATASIIANIAVALFFFVRKFSLI